MLFGLLVFGAIVLLVFWLATTYNGLVATAERTTSAWQELESLLTQRHDELPKFIEFCEPHLRGARADSERALAARSAVVEARQKRDAIALNRAERALRGELGALVARAAASPELGPSPAFGLLRQRHATLDTEIDERRALYNQAVAEHNAALRRPLGNVVALLGGFRALRTLDGDNPVAELP
jgi:LemA protein